MKLRTLILLTLLLGSLTLNVTTMAFSTVAMLVSGAFEAITGIASVMGERDRKIARLSDEMARKETKLVALEKEAKATKTAIYRGEKRLLKDAVADTAGRVSRRTAVGAARNAGSVVAEAIPLAGVAVVIGVTAWDLKDSCDTMKDLHELSLAFDPDAVEAPDTSQVCGLEVPSKDEIWDEVAASPGKAWEAAKSWLPELPPMPKIDWSLWN